MLLKFVKTTIELEPPAIKSEQPKLIIVIPVYNHAGTLLNIVNRALAVHDKVMVVDDGSTDGGAGILAGLDVDVIRHEKNLGKGAAILTAARTARSLGMTHIVTMDADGQHDPNDFRRIVNVLKEDTDAMIIGRRNFQASDIPVLCRISRYLANFWFRVQTGRSVGDARCGFRIYPLAVLENLTLRIRRYAFETEVLVKAAWAGVKLLETDISVYFPPTGKRISQFNIFMDTLRVGLLNFHLTLRSITPLPHRKIMPDKNQPGEKITVLHPLRSTRVLLTENTSPKQLAAAGALGVFLGTLPLIAFHTITILFAAGYFRLNRVAALSISQLCMPPFVPALCIETGYFLRHGKFLTEISLKTVGYQALERVYEWLIGALVLAPVLAALVGCIIFFMAYFIKKKTCSKNREYHKRQQKIG